MKANENIDISNSLEYRKGWGEDKEKHSRTERIVYLSELPDGTLAGTEKMTRSEYARRQKQTRVALGFEAEGLFFSESHAAVAYRAKVGMIKSERQYDTWVVWEEAGPRFESRKGPFKKASKD